ncbi:MULTISPECIES: hypothetical protein [unclassified Curtobacterium]|nr:MULTISPECIES: hypothetical protein [unclassified Curtobacterium]
MSSKKKRIAKGLGASALAVATLASGLAFAPLGATAASASTGEGVQLHSQEGTSQVTPRTKTVRLQGPNGSITGTNFTWWSNNTQWINATASLSPNAGVLATVPAEGEVGTVRAGNSCLSTWSHGHWVWGTCDVKNEWRTSGGYLISGGRTLGLAPNGSAAGPGYHATAGSSIYISALDVPSAPTVTGVFLDDREELARIEVRGRANAKIEVLHKGAVVASGNADTKGLFTYKVAAPNSGERLTFTATQNVAGNVSAVGSAALQYSQVSITSPADQSEVSDSPITVEGKGEAGSEVTVVVNGTDVAPVTVKDNGTWTKAVNIRKGENTIGATQKSKGANTTTSTVVVNPGESANDALSVNVDSVDNDARTALVSGTATAGAQIRVGSTVVATAAADGSWSGRVSGLKAGANTVEFVQYVGGERVDAVSKDIRVVATGFELTSPQNNDVIRTADKSVTFTGLGNPGGKVSVLNGNKPIGSAIVDADGKWSFTSLMAYTEYDLEVYYKKIPTGAVTNKVPLHITVTNNEQNAPFEITAPKHNSTVTAPDNQVSFEGTGTTGGVVTIKKGTNTVGTAEVGADGKWAFTGELSFNKHNLTAYYKKMPGSSAVSSPLTVTVTDGSVVLPFEVTSPANDSVVETADKSVTFTGQGAGGGKVVIKKGNATLAEGLVDSKGKWSLTGTLNYGEQEVTVFHKPVGGSQAQQVRLNLIVQAPAADFAIESPANGDTVAAGPVTFTGVGKEGTTVSVFVNGKSRGTATVENGTWTLQTTAIGAGTHDFVVYHKQGAIAAESETVRLTLR